MKHLFFIPVLMLTLVSCKGNVERSIVTAIPDYDVKRASAKIAIDGRLDEATWRNASAIELQFPWEEQTGKKQSTKARLLWDDEYLYVAYECIDGDITARYETHDDPTYEDDAVELFINPNPSENIYIGLEMSARAALYDYLYRYPKNLEKSYDLKGAKLAVQRDGTLNDSTDQDKSWVLELAIPISNFAEFAGGKPVIAGTTWAVNINRWDGTEPNRRLSMWSDSGQRLPNPHNPQRFGRIHFTR